MSEWGPCCKESLVRKRVVTAEDIKRHRDWRTAVFERDGRKCQVCHQEDCSLEVHHLAPWSESVKLRFEVDNGMVLCHECHREVHDMLDKIKAIKKAINNWRL